MIYMYQMQFQMLFHLPLSNLQSDPKSLSHFEKCPMCWRSFTQYLWIVIWSQIGKWEVKEHAKLHVLRIYRIVIKSKLKSVIGAKVLSSRWWGSAVESTRPKYHGFLSVPGNIPAHAECIGCLDGSGTEPNYSSGPNQDCWRITPTCL